jgi:hypothetical protein
MSINLNKNQLRTALEVPPYYKLTPKFTIYKKDTTVYAMDEDGNVPYSGSDASTVIQSAINALTPNRTWKEKVLLKGNYENLDQIVLPSYVTLEVYGKLKAKANLNEHFIYASNQTQIEIIGGEFDGNGENQSANMDTIYFESVTDSKIEGAIVWTGKRVSTDGEGIELENCSRVTVKGCLGLGLQYGYDPIKLTGTTTHCIIADNIIDQTKDSLYSSRAIQLANQPSYNVVIGNTIYGNGMNPAIKIHGTTTSAMRNVIAKNTVYNCVEGVALIDYASENLVIGNVLHASGLPSNRNAGLSIRATDTSTAYRNCFIDNVVFLRGTANHAGIFIHKNGRNTLIRNNRIIGTGTSGEEGIEIASGAEDTFLDNNLIEDTVANKLVDAGTRTVVAPLKVIPIFSTASFQTWTDMPADETEFLGASFRRLWLNLKGLQCRLTVRIGETAAASGAALKIQYSTNEATWTDLCSVTLGTGTYVTVKGDWTNIPAAIQNTDVVIRLVGINGDNQADPAFGLITLQIRG